MARYTKKEKERALVLAEASTIREAAEKTGIPAGTIKYWRSQTNSNQPTKPSKKVAKIVEEARVEVKEELRDYLAEQSKLIADKMLSYAEQAAEEANNTIANGKTEKEFASQWLKAVIGAMDYMVKNALILSGKEPLNKGVKVDINNVQAIQNNYEKMSDEDLLKEADKYGIDVKGEIN